MGVVNNVMILLAFLAQAALAVEFPDGGTNQKPIVLTNFSQTVHENEKGIGAPWDPPMTGKDL